MRRLLKMSVVAIAGIAGLAAIGTAWAVPTLTAVACPGCYGLENVGDRLIVEHGFDPARLSAIRTDLDTANAMVTAVFGPKRPNPFIVLCATEACDRRLGGRGARATTYSTPFFTAIRVSPRGFDTTYLAHETAHVALHDRVGLRHLLAGDVPAWFDEGVAVIVSRDPRYLRPGTTADERCMPDDGRALPDSSSQWGPAAGREHGIYAIAACRVLRWMQAHGGEAGLVTALDDVAAGKRRLP